MAAEESARSLSEYAGSREDDTAAAGSVTSSQYVHVGTRADDTAAAGSVTSSQYVHVGTRADDIAAGRRRLQYRIASQLRALLDSILRSLAMSVALLVVLFVLTILVAVVFYFVNRHGNTAGSERYRQLKARQAEFNASLQEVARLSRTLGAAEDGQLIEALLRLRQLGRNYAYKDIRRAIEQHELKPTFTQSLYYAVTLVCLIGYGDIVGTSELQYFCATLSMLIVVPVWYMYHHQLYHLFYFLQLYCHSRWTGASVSSSSNHTIAVLWAARLHNANVYRRSRFYLSNLVLMLLMFPLCLAVFAISERRLSIWDQLWLTVQSIFHIGLGDVPPQAAHWPIIFLMISTCFLIYFQCFSFILPQYPSMRLSRIFQI